jgi:hypothetical protein
MPTEHLTPAQIKSMAAECAAGDAAWLPIDGTHSSVMSCQHARPMGRFAGYNAVSDLFGPADAAAKSRLVCDMP